MKISTAGFHIVNNNIESLPVYVNDFTDNLNVEVHVVLYADDTTFINSIRNDLKRNMIQLKVNSCKK